jgi:thiol-disulfide isomerase/thioredoxin
MSRIAQSRISKMGPAHSNQRKTFWLTAALVLFLFSGVAGCRNAATSASAQNAHPDAPAAAFETLDGHTVHLADYRGKVVLLNFWGTWCGACRSEIPELIDLQNQYESKGFTVLGVAMRDERSSVASFITQPRFDVGGRKVAMNYPVVMGNDGLEATFGGFWGYPDTFIISRDGKVVAKGFGVIDEDSTSKLIEKLL